MNQKRIEVVLSGSVFPQGLRIDKTSEQSFRVAFDNVPQPIRFDFHKGEELMVRLANGRVEYVHCGQWFDQIEEGAARESARPPAERLRQIMRWLLGKGA